MVGACKLQPIAVTMTDAERKQVEVMNNKCARVAVEGYRELQQWVRGRAQ